LQQIPELHFVGKDAQIRRIKGFIMLVTKYL